MRKVFLDWIRHAGAGLLVIAAVLPSAHAQEPAARAGANFRMDKVEFDGGAEGLFAKKVRIHGYFAAALTEGAVGIAILNPACEGLLTPDGVQVKGKYTRMARFLAAGGFHVLAVDGFNPRGFPELCTKPKLLAESERFQDAVAGLNFMRQKPEFKGLPAVAFGWGAAGVIPGLRKTSADPQFAAGVAYYGECERISAPYSPGAPLLAMGGDKDEWNPVRFCQELSKTAAPTGPQMSVHVMENAYHSFDSPQGEPRPNKNNPSLGMSGRSEAATKESFRLVTDFLVQHFGFKPSNPN